MPSGEEFQRCADASDCSASLGLFIAVHIWGADHVAKSGNSESGRRREFGTVAQICGEFRDLGKVKAANRSVNSCGGGGGGLGGWLRLGCRRFDLWTQGVSGRGQNRDRWRFGCASGLHRGRLRVGHPTFEPVTF